MKGLIVIPAYQEEARIGSVLSSIRQSAPSSDNLVVDDGSQDGTAEIARVSGVQVLRHPFNLGYGAALQTGYKHAVRHGYDLVVQMDADGQHDPREIPALLLPLERNEADLVVGSRFLEDTGYSMGLARGLGRRLFHWLASLAGMAVTDPTSGFQALSRPVTLFYCNDFFPMDFPDVDVLLLAHRAGFRIREVSIHMAPSPRATSLHGGLKPIYYVYKMILSMWIGATTRRKVEYDKH